MDRVAASAVAQTIQPLVESVLSPQTYAYQRSKGHLRMLARMKHLAEANRCWVVGNFDVSQAFPSVPLELLVSVHRSFVERMRFVLSQRSEDEASQDQRLLQLIETIVRGGLLQGNSFSPIAMELFMNTVLDSHLNQIPTNPLWLRYSDNIVVLCRSVPEAETFRQNVQNRLSAVGMALKPDQLPEAGVIPLDRDNQTTQLLGFLIGMNNGTMTFDIAEQQWQELRESLTECHWAPNPTATAYTTVVSWIHAMGPALSNLRRLSVSERIRALLNECRLEVRNYSGIALTCRKAWTHWVELLGVSH
jgi:hypothetical protein